MRNTTSRVLGSVFAAALCAILSACSGGGNNAIPQTQLQNAPNVPPPATVSTARSTEKVVTDSTAVTSSGFTYSNFTYHITPVYKGSTTAKAAVRPETTTYPLDLAYFGGPVAGTVTTHNVYVDCAQGGPCWGHPYEFLHDLGVSSMLQVAAQYDGAVTLTPGASVGETHTLYTNTLYQNDLLAYIHRAVQRLGGSSSAGMNNIYNLFIPQGVDTCFDQTTACYSPDNYANFAFCAYHGAVDFSDYGLVLFTVEPYQGVPGCDFMNETDLTSAGANVLSHETFETITDPLPGSGWVNPNGYGEIGDECAWSSITPEKLGARTYNIQLEYSNAVHGCSDQPAAAPALR